MDPIVVPAPPRSAYNPNRRVSDLLFSQLKHFQHVALKRGDREIAPDIARDIYTEAGAARYIAAVTRVLRGAAAPQAAEVAAVSAPSPAKETATTIPGVPLPATAATIPAPGKKTASRKAAPKKARKTPRTP